MKLIKPLILVIIASALCINATCQTEVTIRQELSLNPYVVLGGINQYSYLSKVNEQGLGGGASLGYLILFDWIGISMNYYLQSCDAKEEEILKTTSYSMLETEDYGSHGFLIGVEANLPASQGNFNSTFILGFQGGIFITKMPDQTFEREFDFINYYETQVSGFAREFHMGYKADLTKHFALSLSAGMLIERAILYRQSHGTIEDDGYYRWDFNYGTVQLGLKYRI